MTPDLFAARMTIVATNYVGLVEVKSNAEWEDPNTRESEAAKSTELVTLMRRVHWPVGAAYCAAFVGAIIVKTAEASGLNAKGFLALWSAHVMTNVHRLKAAKLGSDEPSDGCVYLAQHGSTDSGHTGFVSKVQGVYPNRDLITIEGNTSRGAVGSQSRGDGIFLKVRNVRSNGDLRTRLFLPASQILELLE